MFCFFQITFLTKSTYLSTHPPKTIFFCFLFLLLPFFVVCSFLFVFLQYKKAKDAIFCSKTSFWYPDNFTKTLFWHPYKLSGQNPLTIGMKGSWADTRTWRSRCKAPGESIERTSRSWANRLLKPTKWLLWGRCWGKTFGKATHGPQWKSISVAYKRYT